MEKKLIVSIQSFQFPVIGKQQNSSTFDKTDKSEL